MIHISKKDECCGCTACAERCPRQCIRMQSDDEGFLYPVVDKEECIHCNLCEKVCPILNSQTPVDILQVSAAKHIDENVRGKSSSGGVFSAIANDVIKQGGVVFGAKFDENWNVVHSYAENMDEVAAFRGSKYVQSSIGECYKDAEQFLKNGRIVLFTGTPCQIAGLKKFLRKEYENLFTIDFICHGVPSPYVWKKYVETLHPKGADSGNTVSSSLNNRSVITGLSFRDKAAGWRKYGFSAEKGVTKGNSHNSVFPLKHTQKYKYEILQSNIFLRGFLQNLYLRPSCYHCHFRNCKSGSDMTIADFWGIQKLLPDFDDDKGCSLIIEKTQRIQNFLQKDLNVRNISSEDYSLAFSGNSALFKDASPSIHRNAFWERFKANPEDVCFHIQKCTLFPKTTEWRHDLIILLMKFHVYGIVKAMMNLIKKRM